MRGRTWLIYGYCAVFFIGITASLVISMRKIDFGTVLVGGSSLRSGGTNVMYVVALDHQGHPIAERAREATVRCLGPSGPLAEGQAAGARGEALKVGLVLADTQRRECALDVSLSMEGGEDAWTLPMQISQHPQASYLWAPAREALREDEKLKNEIEGPIAAYPENGILVRGLANRVWVQASPALSQRKATLSPGSLEASINAQGVARFEGLVPFREKNYVLNIDGSLASIPLRHEPTQVAASWESSPASSHPRRRIQIRALPSRRPLLATVWQGGAILHAEWIPAASDSWAFEIPEGTEGLFHVQVSRALRHAESRTATLVGWQGEPSELAEHLRELSIEDPAAARLLKEAESSRDVLAAGLSRIVPPLGAPRILQNTFAERKAVHESAIGRLRAKIHLLLILSSLAGATLLLAYLLRHSAATKRALEEIDQAEDGPIINHRPWFMIGALAVAIGGLGWILIRFLNDIYWNW